MASEADASRQLAELLEYLKRSRGFDFTGYKKTSLGRRIEKRMEAVGSDSFAAYEDHLEANPREFTELFNTILINVTSFFRDPDAWQYLSDEVVPKLLANRSEGQPVRVWSAGCASGEEAYTLAMALAEAMGPEDFKARAKIYATDLDENALATARHGVYTTRDLKNVPEPLLEKYFEPNSRGLAFRTDLRRTIIFGRNDLIADAPISRIDLLACRNVLMYFTPEVQARVLERFNFALDPAGFLFLGKSEMLITHGEWFAPHNLKWRVFRKVQRNDLRDRLAFVAPAGADAPVVRDTGLREAASELLPVAQIVVDDAGFLIDANRRARELFAIVEADLGKPFQDIPLSYRPVDLRSAIDGVRASGAAVHIERIPYASPQGRARTLDIAVEPILGHDRQLLGTSVTFADVTTLVQLDEQYQRSRDELGTAYEELQSTVEELETTNEELQSTNEELETTNEELQSTNEELETMNEELQSTNDELETMNGEVNSRATQLDRVNLFFDGILASLGVAVVVLDQTNHVQVWNTMASELWGLRADEVEGRDFLQLDIGLPVGQLEEPIARARGSSEAVETRVGAINRRGRQIECLVRVRPLATRAGEIYGAMLLMEPAEGSDSQ